MVFIRAVMPYYRVRYIGKGDSMINRFIFAKLAYRVSALEPDRSTWYELDERSLAPFDLF